MRALVPVAIAMLMAGCASSTMQASRAGSPSAQLDSGKNPDVVAQCIQYRWQDEAMFGEDAGAYLEARKGGGFTVYTREAQAFVDVHSQAGGTRVDFYAQQQNNMTLWRKASAATCL